MNMANISKAERERRAAIASADVESPSQNLAMRIWDGQSPDVAVIERVARIANALKGHNMPLDIELPHPDAGRYLEAHR